MAVLRELVRGIRAVFRKEQRSREMDEELRVYLESAAADQMRRGMSREAALRAARVEIGSMETVKQNVRAAGWESAVDALWMDLRYGVRQLGKTPAFTLVCVLTLALGIGANTAVFSVMNAVLLRSLPVADPERVVYLNTSSPPHRTGTVDWHATFSYPVYEALRQQHGALQAVMAYVPLSTDKVAVRIGAQPEETEADMVSGNFFSGLGVKLARGRGFSAEDEAGHAPVAVISYGYWTRRFSRSPDAGAYQSVLGEEYRQNYLQVSRKQRVDEVRYKAIAESMLNQRVGDDPWSDETWKSEAWQSIASKKNFPALHDLLSHGLGYTEYFRQPLDAASNELRSQVKGDNSQPIDRYSAVKDESACQKAVRELLGRGGKAES